MTHQAGYDALRNPQPCGDVHVCLIPHFPFDVDLPRHRRKDVACELPRGHAGRHECHDVDLDMAVWDIWGAKP